MGFGIRKSFKIAPGLRVNVSKSGLGLSGGVKGARISVNQKGTTVYVGAGPIRYQKRLSTRKSNKLTKNKDKSNYNPFELVRPTNWHAWLLFFSFIPTLVLLSGSETAFAMGMVTLPLMWLYVYLFSGPQSLKGYKKYKKAVKKNSFGESKLNFLIKSYEMYPCDHIKLQLASACYEEKQFEEAVKHSEEILQQHIEPSVSAICGVSYLNLEQFEDALLHLEHCDEKEEYIHFMTILRAKAKCHMGLKAFDRALEIVAEGLRRKGDAHIENKRALRLLRAEIYYEINDTKKAIKEIEKLIAEAPTYIEAQEFLSKLKSVA